MIEQGIYFALGCIVTALCALMFAPVFWRRALRLTRQRLRLQVPLSMQEIAAERDGLRAQFAVERVRLERAVERVRAEKAADLAAIGRHSVAAATAVAERDALATQVGEKDGEIKRLHDTLTEAAAAGGLSESALLEARARAEETAHAAKAASKKAEDSAAEIERLREELDHQRGERAAAETRAMGLEMRLTDASRGEAGRVKVAEDALRGKLEAAMAQSTRHESSGISLRQELDDAKSTIRKLGEDLALAQAALDDAREREKGLHLQSSLKAERMRAADRDAGDQVAVLREEKAALQRALDEAKRQGPAAPGSPASPTDDGDAELRASIHALGKAVAEMMREARASGGADASRQAAGAD